MRDVGGTNGVDVNESTNIILTAVIQAVASAGRLPSAIAGSLQSSLAWLSPGKVQVVSDVTRGVGTIFNSRPRSEEPELLSSSSC